jgi:2,4-dienoyl-CoA reductase (NADPH2)
MKTYTSCLQTLDLGHVVLKNRFMMGSMHTGLEEAENGFQRMAAFYAERAAGGAALIVTGGVSPNEAGKLGLGPAERTMVSMVDKHRLITDAVHQHDGKILLQLLHAGRYSKHDSPVAPSPIQSPINRITPRELASDEILQTIEDFASSALLAKQAGYDGVEIMGSEGYLISQFLAARTNHREDEWGGNWLKRKKFALKVIDKVRQAVGSNWIIMFRISVLDLVEGGLTQDEILDLARDAETAGASLLDSGIGWHESRVPTIMGSVPHGGFSWATRRLKDAVSIPVIACNRINHPDIAEDIISKGDADMVSMARPWLADGAFAHKVQNGKIESINTCIACNQACLDLVFVGKEATCLVNPRACRETLINIQPARSPKRIAVVGAGPAGLSCATALGERGHRVTMFEASSNLGGQFNLAAAIPGKDDYRQTVRYFQQQLQQYNVDVRLDRHVSAATLIESGFDEVVLATGINPRTPNIPGIDGPNVMAYAEVLSGQRIPGRRVAIIGAGGIGFDMAEFLVGTTHEGPEDFANEWGIGLSNEMPGGLLTENVLHEAERKVFLCQRNDQRFGRTLGKSTGWALRISLEKRGINFIGGARYIAIDEQGLHIEQAGEQKILAVDTIVVCAGQTENRDLYNELIAGAVPTHLIGGADLAAELDAKRAIEQGLLLANKL